jgi:DNA transformation protein and related proteins
MAIDKDFAQYCCELLSSAGPCAARRMFGGFGISTDGLTLAILADLGDGEKLWLKGDDASRSQYEAAGCAMFTYDAKGVHRSMKYFSAPEDTMDSADAMRPWAALALQCAVRAQAAKRKPVAKFVAKPAQVGLSQAVLVRAREAAVTAAAKKPATSDSLPIAKPSKPVVKRAIAPAPKPAAKRKSAKGASTAAQ